MTNGKMPRPRKPPKEPVKSVQFDLFTAFLTNDDGAVSNAIELWDGIPKYFLTARQQDSLRTGDGLAPSYLWEYTYQGRPCKVRIQPALIEQKDGRDKACFPSVTEELVEEALKKLLTDQRVGMHDPDKVESWVKFTLSMICRELKARGRERNRQQIKHAIAVLSGCIITLYQDGKEVYKGPILSDLVTVNREEYLADSDSYHVARLPIFVSHSINQLEYRQFNYSRLMELNEQLSRWLYKRLVHRYRHASLIDTYHFMFSEVKQGSGLLQQARDIDNRRKMLSALDELKNNGVLLNFDANELKESRKVVDVKYTVTGAPDFIREQKAANKRERDNLTKAQALHLVDKTS
jgi:hypothetical protein